MQVYLNKDQLTSERKRTKALLIVKQYEIKLKRGSFGSEVKLMTQFRRAEIGLICILKHKHLLQPIRNILKFGSLPTINTR